MGEAAETGDHYPVTLGEVEKALEQLALVGGGAVQQQAIAVQRAFLAGEVLGVLQHQADEHLANRREPPLQATGQAVGHQRLGAGIAGIGA
ncbi:hypothetical protein D3C72_2161310 [compost metagenome]